ncbi:MAG: hypothetical protein FD147_1160 [Chloroflexi bacterium]|nr:MAG: hypothetical protein FD147_1160 [Chloroflexota bacterium]MBA4375066.1 hypothetical protein [Anaerolinea sp.]
MNPTLLTVYFPFIMKMRNPKSRFLHPNYFQLQRELFTLEGKQGLASLVSKQVQRQTDLYTAIAHSEGAF